MKKTIITIIIMILTSFSVLAIVGHPANQVFPGLFASGNYTFGTNVLFIDDTNDRVGIGTSSPTRVLDIQGGGSFYPLFINTSNQAVASFETSKSTGPQIRFMQGSNQLFLIGTTSAFLNSGTDHNMTLLADKAGTGIKFWTGGVATTRMFISPGGNVGIGTDDPSTTLDVDGQITQSTEVIKVVIPTKTITDNVATAVARITASDGGAYSVRVHAVIGHAASAGSGTAAGKGFEATFARAQDGTPDGANTAVIEIWETAATGDNLPARSIGTVTMTAVENSETQTDITFLVDATGFSAGNPTVTLFIEFTYTGFSTPPTITEL